MDDFLETLHKHLYLLGVSHRGILSECEDRDLLHKPSVPL
jgi:hypothetical protein